MYDTYDQYDRFFNKVLFKCVPKDGYSSLKTGHSQFLFIYSSIIVLGNIQTFNKCAMKTEIQELLKETWNSVRIITCIVKTNSFFKCQSILFSEPVDIFC